MGYNDFTKKIIQIKEIWAVAHGDTVVKQMIALVPRYEFDALAKIHYAGQKFRAYNRWGQFLAMLIGQLPGRKILRDITDNLKAQGKRLYHLGMKNTSKATLARVNAEQSTPPVPNVVRQAESMPISCSKTQVFLPWQALSAGSHSDRSLFIRIPLGRIR